LTFTFATYCFVDTLLQSKNEVG